MLAEPLNRITVKNDRCVSRHRDDTSANGWITPVSLFAAMTETIQVVPFAARVFSRSDSETRPIRGNRDFDEHGCRNAGLPGASTEGCSTEDITQ